MKIIWDLSYNAMLLNIKIWKNFWIYGRFDRKMLIFILCLVQDYLITIWTGALKQWCELCLLYDLGYLAVLIYVGMNI